jgi:hypothetical protein
MAGATTTAAAAGGTLTDVKSTVFEALPMPLPMPLPSLSDHFGPRKKARTPATSPETAAVTPTAGVELTDNGEQVEYRITAWPGATPLQALLPKIAAFRARTMTGRKRSRAGGNVAHRASEAVTGSAKFTAEEARCALMKAVGQNGAACPTEVLSQLLVELEPYRFTATSQTLKEYNLSWPRLPRGLPTNDNTSSCSVFEFRPKVQTPKTLFITVETANRGTLRFAAKLVTGTQHLRSSTYPRTPRGRGIS